MKKIKQISIHFGIIINLLIFCITGYTITNECKIKLNSLYQDTIEQANKYISDIKTTLLSIT